MKKGVIFLSLFLFVFLIFSEKKPLAQDGINTASEQMHSSNIIDAKPYKIEGHNYTALLNNDYLFVVDENGSVVKKIYALEDHHVFTDDDSSQFNFKMVSFEIIPDIDKLGKNDFLVVVKVGTFEGIYAISYEQNKILWKYNSKIETTMKCSFNENCQENTGILNYTIKNDKLFVTAPNRLNVVNLKNGKELMYRNFSTFIWDVEEISDLNHDGVKDLAIAVLPTNVIFLNGKNLKTLSEHPLSEDISLKKRNVVVKTSIFDLMYDEGRGLLIASGEDGHAYEIKPENFEIVHNYELFTNFTPIYDRLISGETSRYYTSYKDGDKTIIYFGYTTYAMNQLKIIPIDSIDQDQYKDYIVRYNFIKAGAYYASSPQASFTVISSKNGISFQDQNFQFLGIYQNKVLYSNGNHYYILDLTTMDQYEKDIKSAYKDYIDPFIESYTELHMAGDQILLNFDGKILFYFDLTDSSVPTHFTYFMKEQTYEKIDQGLIIYDQSFLSLSGFTLYDQNMNSVTSYHTQNSILSHTTDETTLYLLENDGSHYFYELFNLSDGKECLKGELTDFNVQHIISINDELFVDTNNDGFKEMLLKINYISDTDQNLTTYFLYDIKNNSILSSDTTERSVKASYPINYQDVTGDKIPEIVYYYYDDATKHTVFDIYDLMEQKLIQETSYSINLEKNRIEAIIDLDHDGNKELVFDYTEKQVSAYIINLKDETFNKITNSFQESYNIDLDLSLNDINQDGIIDIAFYEIENNEPILNRFPLRVSILNYKDGELSTEFTKELFVPYDLQPNIPVSYVTSYKVNQLIFYGEDYVGNSIIETYDYENGNKINESKINILTREKNVSVNDKTLTYTPIKSITIMDQPYIQVSPVGTRSFMKILFNQNNDLWNYLPTSYRGFYYDRILFNNPSTQLLEFGVPLNVNLIQSNLSGLFNTAYQFTIDSQNIKEVKVYYSKFQQPFTEFKGNHLKTNLQEGEYDLIYYIYTKDGNCFYYTDHLVIKETLQNTIIEIIGLVVISGMVFLISKRLINRLYLQK